MKNPTTLLQIINLFLILTPPPPINALTPEGLPATKNSPEQYYKNIWNNSPFTKLILKVDNKQPTIKPENPLTTTYSLVGITGNPGSYRIILADKIQNSQITIQQGKKNEQKIEILDVKLTKNIYESQTRLQQGAESAWIGIDKEYLKSRAQITNTRNRKNPNIKKTKKTRQRNPLKKPPKRPHPLQK